MSAKLTPEDFYAAAQKLLDAPPPRPRNEIVAGDNFELAKAAIEAGWFVYVTPRVRTLLGEHMPVE